MASQSAVINIGFTRTSVARKNGVASAALQCGALEAANNYAGGTGLLASARSKYKLPSINVPFSRLPDGTPLYVDAAWYRIFDYVVNTQLGGINGPTLGDITMTVDSTRSSAIEAQNAVSVVAQTVNANASTLAATVEVAQTSALPGAAQIHPPVYTSRGIQP